MTFRPDRIWLALLLACAAIPAVAGQGDDALARARGALDRGDGIAAEIDARKALEQGMPRSAVSAAMGEAYVLQGEDGKALQWLEPADFDQDSAEAGLRALGRLKTDRGEFVEAAEAFNRAIARGAESSGLWVDIARMRYRSGEQHIVGGAINRALALDPRDPEALSMQAQLVRDSRGLVAALPWFERAVETAPDNVGLLGDYAATLGEVGRYKDMLAVVRHMFKLDPGNQQVFFLQAVLAARAGQDNLARRLLWRAGDDSATTPVGLVLSGVLEFRTGHPALAVERFDDLVRMQPDNPTAANLLARALSAAGDLSETAARLEPLARRSDASPYVLTLLARTYEQLGRRADAAPLLDRAARGASAELLPYPVAGDVMAMGYPWGGDSGRAEDGVTQLRRLLGTGQRDAATAVARDLDERFPGAVDIESLNGDTALLTGRPDVALRYYEQAGEVRRTTALVRRVVLAMKMFGEPAAADRFLAGSLALDPGNPILAAQYGRRLTEQGNWPQAVVLLDHAVRLGGGRDPRLLADLAQAQLKTGDIDAALANAREAYRIQRARPEAAAVLAAALAAKGEGGAQVLLAKVKRLGAATGLAAR
ncbi:tetratricopeptide repeat protein [Altererythrobacter salegens]|uniref:Tetratricopeptide repeat protein n=1 Tax=Croceibacterium salegens TaxID=1737568 RepID=A0A6I4ST76_9SPHN|nr:tetratricopeptide repeat protein [Croceibacterium salegens]MXO58729.1 tetratricopeptide repeat protein [Croceibacterium salegens]